MSWRGLLTRRIEAYHHAAVTAHGERKAGKRESGNASTRESAPSIHESEHENTLAHLPPADLDVRSLLQARLVASSLTETAWREASYTPVTTFTRAMLSAEVLDAGPERVRIAMQGHRSFAGLKFDLTVEADGALTFDIDWHALALTPNSLMAFEASLSARTAVTVACDAAVTRWTAPIESVAKSERGLERTVQGQAVLMLVPVAVGKAQVRFTSAP